MYKKSTISRDEFITDFLKNNIIAIIFSIIVLFGIIMTKQTPLFIINGLLQAMTKNIFFILALLIPIMAGMGFNFSIVIGVMAGQFAIIMSVNWGVSGFFGFLITVIIATLFALLFGFIAGAILNKARGHEMITSLFIGYIGGNIYQYILLFLIGAVIPLTATDLILSSGVGLKNTIDLNGTLYQSLDGLIKMKFFILLLIIGLVLLALNIYLLKKNNPKKNKIKIIPGIVISSIISLISAFIMLVSVLPQKILELKQIEFPVITGLLISALILCFLMMPRTKFGKDIILIGSDQNVEISSKRKSKLRIIAIVISTVLAALGQIIYSQGTGVMMTFGSYQSIGLFSIAILIIGGASLKKATVWQALIGLFLYQGFMIIFIPVFSDIFSPNLAGIISSIIMNGVYLYAFTMTIKNNNKSKSLLDINKLS